MGADVIFIFMMLFEIVISIENHNITNSTVNEEIIVPRALKSKIRFDEDNAIHFQDNLIQKGTKNKIKFYDTDTIGYGLIKNERDKSKPIKFVETVTINPNNEVNQSNNGNENQQTIDTNELQPNIKFEDEITNQNPGQKKKRRKRRKPRLQNIAPGYYPHQLNGQKPYPVMPGSGENYGFYQGYGQLGGLQQNLGHQRPGVPGGRPFRGYPHRPPDDALSSITEALTSIARYDDLQCVPRLLCEVAGGRAPAQTQAAGILQTMVNLQPLVTLLAAYNGLSTSPLFVFGRAVILGMSSRGSTSACQSSYPLCPNDPEKLVEYLNNHNGGFFRFFNSPHLGQNQNYLIQNIDSNQNYFNQNLIGNGYYGYQNGYGLPQETYGFNNQGTQFPYQNYRFNQLNYPQYGFAKVSENNEVDKDKNYFNSIENQIEDRIVNINDHVTNWAFPKEDFEDNARLGKGFIFPDKSNVDTNKLGLKFSENVNMYQSLAEGVKSKVGADEELVYILRGDGDPNYPEIVKIKKGKAVL